MAVRDRIWCCSTARHSNKARKCNNVKFITFLKSFQQVEIKYLQGCLLDNLALARRFTSIFVGAFSTGFVLILIFGDNACSDALHTASHFHITSQGEYHD
ncbi:hypothetical protein IHQ71_29855 (plasmid) [Rhizobium sp. TH2]|uniref:hypothetical protein n=1 Tax=Rhizobium sp. TH2 TaxID=2775403 RepID=UPI0021580F76|nr:hypothetical protein [Rhizobium sp. TH2]UVC12239.1 hypothetical protein IHQ71_29855 [Rhizobium sp. TH2]